MEVLLNSELEEEVAHEADNTDNGEEDLDRPSVTHESPPLKNLVMAHVDTLVERVCPCRAIH